MSANPPPVPPALLLGRVLPPGVVWRAARIDEHAAPLHPLEALAVARAVPKRRREFAAGRQCAREALQVLCGEAHPLLAGPDRAPQWPDGVVGSITHNDEFCAAAVAPASEVAGLGIDIDTLARFDDSLEAIICTGNEIERWLRGHAGKERQRRFAAIFSVKEAFYKAQYAVSRAWLGFEDVEVTRLDDLYSPVAEVDIRVLQAPQARAGSAPLPEVVAWLTSQRWSGLCALDAEHVAAAVVLRH